MILPRQFKTLFRRPMVNISICMLKICREHISKPLKIIFKSCIKRSVFLLLKRANKVLVHKKCDKQMSRNYRHVSLLPICQNIFERLIYHNLFKLFIKNNLISLINQILNKMTHAYISFYLLQIKF